MRKLWRFIILLFVYSILAFLPLIPVTAAPTIPDPTYRFTLCSLLGTYGTCGIHYRYHWYSYVAVLALLSVAIFLARKILVPPKR